VCVVYASLRCPNCCADKGDGLRETVKADNLQIWWGCHFVAILKFSKLSFNVLRKGRAIAASFTLLVAIARLAVPVQETFLTKQQSSSALGMIAKFRGPVFRCPVSRGTGPCFKRLRTFGSINSRL